jgi:hydroxypyruvate reductase
MAAAVLDVPDLSIRQILAVGTHQSRQLPVRVEWIEAGHPLPDGRSVEAGRRARAIAAAVPESDHLLLLLSGGASAMLVVPAAGITLEDKRSTITRLLRAGADIEALNTVRKHLSSLKGGQLAAASRGPTTTLAVSDVAGDDLSVIGSGPGIPDPSTWADAAVALERFQNLEYPPAVRARMAAGLGGDIPDTPKPGSRAMAKASGHVIATRRDALQAAKQAAESRGYRVVVLDEFIAGEARRAAVQWYEMLQNLLSSTSEPVCALSSGETTVHVVGDGTGGRNQEFALALVEATSGLQRDVVIASVGTDGIDGPTHAAGALVDRTTRERAAALGMEPNDYLDRNDSFAFFEGLGDLIRTGRTDTNVGDLQVLLAR